MNRDEAKFILTAYRPNGQDATHPDFNEALEMADVDPELRVWFANEQRMDIFVSTSLRKVMPPIDLREKLLAGGHISRISASDARKHWFFQPKILSWAAILLFAALLSIRFLTPVAGNNLAEFAMNYADRGFLLEAHGNDLEKLQNWLEKKNLPTPDHIPDRLVSLKKLGCRTANFQGKQVSIICFGADKEYHLFVVRKTDFPELASLTSPKMKSAGKWASAAWSDAENGYVLVGNTPENTLKAFL